MDTATEIQVLGKKVRLLQPAKGFRTSLDSVMLAAACPVKAGQRVLDMGCGVGGAAFCVLARVPGAVVTGVDVQIDYVDLAQRNAVLNEAADRASFIYTDIRTYQSEERFDHVMCNPPYLEAGHHLPSPEEGKAIANGHQDEALSLKDWIDAGFRLLKSGGSLTMIHRADVTDKIILALGKRFGAVEVIPLWPKAGIDAKRVIIRAVKDRKSPATLHAGLVLHEENGDYTAAAEAVLREGAAL